MTLFFIDSIISATNVSFLYSNDSLEFSDSTPPEARSFIYGLLKANPNERIGYVDSAAVLSHEFFSGD